MNNIIFTGDILRPNSKMKPIATRDVVWLYNLFKNQIKNVTNIEPGLLLWDDIHFSAKIFANKNNMELNNVFDWVKSYNNTDATEEASEYLCANFKNSLVIGYELSNLMMHIFNKQGIPYINLTLHPVRFLSDVFFMFCTNNKDVFENLKRYIIDTNLFASEAGYIKATLNRRKIKNFGEDIAIIIGQTEVDAAIVDDDGNLLSLKNYSKEIENICNTHKKVFYKPHPYASNKEEMIAYMNNFNIETIEGNFYTILSQDNLKDIYAISSSCIYESKFFNVNGHYLYKSAFDIITEKTDPFTTTRYVPIFEKYYLSSFWANILSPFFKVREIQNDTYNTFQNKLRKSLNAYWGYDFDKQTTVEIKTNNTNNTNSFKGMLNKILLKK